MFLLFSLFSFSFLFPPFFFSFLVSPPHPLVDLGGLPLLLVVWAVSPPLLVEVAPLPLVGWLLLLLLGLEV